MRKQVTLIGEGADDAGGVFDETIALMCIELEDGTLPFLLPTPNARNKCGYNTDRFVLNPGCSSKTDMDYYRFMGVMFGVAIRTTKPLSLHISPMVWKLIAGIEITMDDLEEVDSAFMQAMRGIWKLSEDITPSTFSEMIPISSYEAYNMAGQLAPVVTGGSNIPLTYSNRKEYVEKAIQFRLHELDRQALAVREGMSLVIPVPLLSLTTGASLETSVCGERELDIQILKRVAKYRDCSANDMLVKWLWDTLENFTNDEKILFLRFTSGRSRLPSRVQDVTQRLLVIKTMKNKNALPTAQTCFFHLKLPNYTSQEILAARLRYAINNCRSIDTDSYMLPRNTEGGASTSDDEY
ncbi:E3 ubiquitin-protein ligase HERC1-like [Oopsacas minuta]|uniref:E3 ubiquitin-protein ligase HERC1-like n=1 Tax=Oopsacas minuta TaxID=111878 RepID=A0AAV7KAP2_9METZ|nr:E3 ubiquitin-protein ligase HERC1-like [Oopsacas minuta]